VETPSARALRARDHHIPFFIPFPFPQNNFIALLCARDGEAFSPHYAPFRLHGGSRAGGGGRRRDFMQRDTSRYSTFVAATAVELRSPPSPFSDSHREPSSVAGSKFTRPVTRQTFAPCILRVEEGTSGILFEQPWASKSAKLRRRRAGAEERAGARNEPSRGVSSR